MVDHKLAGVPENEDTLAEMLMNGSIFLPNRAGGPVWDIMLPETGKLMKAVRLADPSILMLSPDEKPIEYSFIEGKKAKSVNTTSPTESEAKPTLGLEKPADQKTNVEEKSSPDSIKQNPQESTKIQPKQESDKHVHSVQEPGNNSKTSNSQNPQLAANQSSSPASHGRRGQLFESLTEDSRLLLGAVLDDYLDGSSDFPVFFCNEGFAISVDEFRSKGISEIPVLKEIGNRAGSSKRWLVTAAGSSKQTMTIRHNGKQVECFVLNLAVAKGLGFPDQKTKE
jgi:hypothetical protein